MDPRFDIYNSHRNYDLKYFLAHDSHLSYLKTLPLPYLFPLVKQLPTQTPGIYTLSGGRQIGKSTLLKQWMAHLMSTLKIPAKNILFLTGDIIDDYHQLLTIITTSLDQMPSSELLYIIIDEVSYIKSWDRCVKFLADAGYLRKVVLMLSGSDTTMLDEARVRFPGRRGTADKVDFQLHPLSFFEFLQLVDNQLALLTQDVLDPTQMQHLFRQFTHYLEHGGYLSAINDIASYGKINNATLMVYSDWIRGDIIKRNKQEVYLREILSGIVKNYSSQISWNNLAKSLSIEHHKTVADYADLLARMDAVFIQAALQEDKLSAAPKKARKVFFTDPFVFHAVRAWLNPVTNSYQEQIKQTINSPEQSAQLVETVVVNHFRRAYPTYYIKAEGEVDVAYINHNKFWPVEIKWSNQLRPKDLKQIKKYHNAVIWSKTMTAAKIADVPIEPLPLALARLKA